MSCLSGLEGAGRKRTPAKVQRAALPPYAMNFLRNGGHIFAPQRILGHESLEMVRRYMSVAQMGLERAHERLPAF